MEEPIIDVENVSSWKKLIRVTAYVMRFANKKCVQKAQDNANIKTVELDPDEIMKAVLDLTGSKGVE